MGRAMNAGTSSDAGIFATCKRGGLTTAEVREIESHRAKERPTPWQALALRYGRCEADIRALFEAANDDALIAVPPPPPWPAKRDTMAERDATFKALWIAGESSDVITQRTGVPRNSFYPVRKRLGLRARGQKV